VPGRYAVEAFPIIRPAAACQDRLVLSDGPTVNMPEMVVIDAPWSRAAIGDADHLIAEGIYVKATMPNGDDDEAAWVFGQQVEEILGGCVRECDALDCFFRLILREKRLEVDRAKGGKPY
jgi:hypothetical protein